LVHDFIQFAKQQVTDNIMENVLEILHKKLPDMKGKILTIKEKQMHNITILLKPN